MRVTALMLVLMNVKEVGEFSVVISINAQAVKPKLNSPHRHIHTNFQLKETRTISNFSFQYGCFKHLERA